MEERKTSHSQEIVGKRLQEELGSSDRTVKPVKCEDNRDMHVNDRTVKPVKHFKVIFNNIEQSTLSAENHKMRSKLLGTLICAR